MSALILGFTLASFFNLQNATCGNTWMIFDKFYFAIPNSSQSEALNGAVTATTVNHIAVSTASGKAIGATINSTMVDCDTTPIDLCFALNDSLILDGQPGLTNYQWYRSINGGPESPIAGATSAKYVVTSPGVYSYKATLADGCTAVSCCPIPVVNKCMDLALAKVLASGQSPQVAPGDLVNYTIYVVNQGDIAADNILVTDYIPSVQTLADANWTAAGSNATRVLNVGDELPAGGLLPGDTAIVNITLKLDAPLEAGAEIKNWAEIGGQTDVEGNPRSDIDSRPDSNQADDKFLVDNDINGNGKAGGDEDDHDPASVFIKPFDLALYKQLAPGQSEFISPGDVRTFNITVANQGAITANNIEVTDYIPTGMTLMDANWTLSGSKAKRTLNVGDELPVGGLKPGEDVVVTIMLKVPSVLAKGTKLVNWAEISQAWDINGNPTVDKDSWPDDNQGNDKFLIDDYIGGDAKNGADDEDDHDKAELMYKVFDLALRKTYVSGDPMPGSDVTFKIQVYNQGDVDAFNVEVTDYIPSNASLSPADANGWVLSGTKATNVISNLPKGTSTSIEIVLRISNSVTNGEKVKNLAEISSADDDEDPNNTPPKDIDSMPDNDPNNDGTVKDNVINEDGKNGGDEDDHDPAEVTVTKCMIVLQEPLPVDATVECDAVPAVPTIALKTECCANTKLSFNEQEIKDPAGCVTQIIRKYSWIDDCGNTKEFTYTLSVHDTKPPVMSGQPVDMTIECGDPIPPVTSVTATDACDENVQVTYTETTQPGDCKGNYILKRVWRAKDNCGNEAQHVQYVTVHDTKKPIFMNPQADITIECDKGTTTPPTPMVKDACDESPEIVATGVKETPGPCPGSKIFNYTWIASDDCGNTAVLTQKITIIDTKAPVIMFTHPDLVNVKDGDTLVVGCDFSTIYGLDAVKVNDNCDPLPKLWFYDTTLVKTPCYDLIICTWYAKDKCGNQSSLTFYMKKGDVKAPVITGVPANATITCNDPIPAKPTVGVTDDCDKNVTLDYKEEKSTGCPQVITRTWTATDHCNHVTTASYKITITDNKGPVFTFVPADANGDCGSVPGIQNPTATDECSNPVTITLAENESGTGCDKKLVRTWTAKDACGNTTTASQTISLKDNTKPVFTSVPGEISVQCGQTPGSSTATATDACDQNVTVSHNDVEQGSGCDKKIIRTFTATDDCGNTATATQVIKVTDSEKPKFTSTPSDITADCGQTPGGQDPTASDNCDPSVTITHNDAEQGSGCDKKIIRTYTATDDCGNTATITQTIHISDKTAPTFMPMHPMLVGATNGQEFTIDCDKVAVLSASDMKGKDNCDTDVKITFKETVKLGDCVKDGYKMILTCSWTAMDDCGNTATFFIVVKVVDNKAPVFSNAPANVTISCNDALPTDKPTVSDNCDPNPGLIESVNEKDIPCGKEITRTWKAVDNCGNVSTHVQVITKKDTKAPIITGVPSDITVNLDNGGSIPPVSQDVKANDDCGSSNITVAETETPTNNCGGKIITRTWTAVDNCNNSATAKQVITVIKTCGCQKPELKDVIFVDPTCDHPNSGKATILTKLPESNYIFTWTPDLGVANAIGNERTQLPAGTYSVIIRDKSFDTCWIKVDITISPAQGCCKSVISEELIEVKTKKCDELAEVCIPLSIDKLLEYILSDNGSPYANGFKGCDFDTSISYTYFALPGSGESGPYSIKWSIGAQQFTGNFNNSNELTALMNQWDPAGAWVKDAVTFTISGGVPGKAYGKMEVEQTNTTAQGMMEPNLNLVPHGAQIKLGVGVHEILLTHKQTQCQDTVVVKVICDPNGNILAVDDSIKGRQNRDLYINALLNDQFNIQDLKDINITKNPNHGDVVILDNLKFLYSPDKDFCGQDVFSYEICLNDGTCDEADVYIDIECVKFTIFNGLSPNDDGYNDTFTIQGIEDYPNNELLVFNRWGHMVFSQTGYKNTWKGDWENHPLPDGTYYYILNLNNEEKSRYCGYLQIHR